MELPLLILDLDETLIWAREEHASRCDFRVFSYSVNRRPWLNEFLRRVRQWYRIAVWTSSGEEYAGDVVAHIFGSKPNLEFVWANSRCRRRYDPERQHHYEIKDLKKVKKRGYSLCHVLMLDDSPEKLQRNFGNHLQLKPFEGDPLDQELLDVLPYLEWLSKEDDFRAIDKRSWRQHEL